MAIQSRFSRLLPLTVLVGAVSTPVVAVTLDVLGVVNLVSDGFPVEIATFANITGAFGSATLTLALVLLYREQTKIQQRQEAWMEAEHVPDVFVDEWVVTRDRVELKLSNLGTGVARNLRVVVVAESGSTHGVSRVTLRTRMTRASSSAQVLRPDENDTVELTGEFELGEADGDVDTTEMNVEQILTWLNAEECPVETTVRIEYDYVRRRSGSQHVLSCVTAPEAATTVEGLLSATEGYSDERDNTPPANLRRTSEDLSPEQRYDTT